MNARLPGVIHSKPSEIGYFKGSFRSSIYNKYTNYTNCEHLLFSSFDSSQPFFARLGPLAADPPGELDVLGHDGDPLGVDGAQVGVLEEAHEVGLRCLLKEIFLRQDYIRSKITIILPGDCGLRLPGWLCQNCQQQK